MFIILIVSIAYLKLSTDGLQNRIDMIETKQKVLSDLSNPETCPKILMGRLDNPEIVGYKVNADVISLNEVNVAEIKLVFQDDTTEKITLDLIVNPINTKIVGCAGHKLELVDLL